MWPLSTVFMRKRKRQRDRGHRGILNPALDHLWGGIHLDRRRLEEVRNQQEGMHLVEKGKCR